MPDEDHRHQRPVVEDRRRLLPGRRDVPGLGTATARGDLAGLAQRIDYLADLGVTCLWLMPFYPTPDRDDGYDITDFYGVDPRLGTHGDLVELIRTARDRGMRVIVDLVVNHTSDKHPWFRSARVEQGLAATATGTSGATSRRRTRRSDVVFPDQETASGRCDEKAGAVLPAPVLQAPARPQRRQPARCATRSRKVMGFWLQLGLVRVPGRRRAVPARDGGHRRTARSAARPARVPARRCARFLGRRSGRRRSCSAR